MAHVIRFLNNFTMPITVFNSILLIPVALCMLTHCVYRLTTFTVPMFAGTLDCRVCGVQVTGRQQALECNSCRGRVHRKCGTGFTQDEYRQIQRRMKNDNSYGFQWQCAECRNEVDTLSSFGVPEHSSTPNQQRLGY